ncbi:hypothetical protein CSQ91_21655 [Janthinobacterium sp. BJB301]|uniref:hypothetical protein n=1 Tax=Janthinobacterium sp. BJB301 TaxID=1560195 RepID=UPI000C0C709B|nr:hypothetical protein [Janthinobacterium sp. BJB301]PHV48385.1 hypothetical protein CSQ91_21655 [Janthinobacterium sp. BJB301]
MNKAIDISALNTLNTLQRDQYGALNLRRHLSPELQAQAAQFMGTAIKVGLLPQPAVFTR